MHCRTSYGSDVLSWHKVHGAFLKFCRQEIIEDANRCAASIIKPGLRQRVIAFSQVIENARHFVCYDYLLKVKRNVELELEAVHALQKQGAPIRHGKEDGNGAFRDEVKTRVPAW